MLCHGSLLEERLMTVKNKYLHLFQQPMSGVKGITLFARNERSRLDEKVYLQTHNHSAEKYMIFPCILNALTLPAKLIDFGAQTHCV